MKRREGRRAQSADLLVCFPSRAHLALMPKPICSPARPPEPSKRHHSRHPHHHRRQQQQQQHHLTRKSSTKIGAGQASPLLWSKSKQLGSDISEPTSPKVTCVGQIKVRHKNTACKSWQSVMEEIERIHNERKQKKRSTWMDSLGFKKEVMQFLTCLRSIRFDFRCFGSFPQSDNTTDDDEDDEEGDEEELQRSHVRGEGNDGKGAASRTVFSRWFMVLQENQNNGFCREEEKEKQRVYGDESLAAAPSVPPQNALLLMRSRSAPAKSWLEEKEEEEEEEENIKKEEKKGKNLKTLMEEEKRNDKKESLLVMRNDSDFYKISSDIAKETWVVGGMRSDPFSRSRSWKR